MVNGTPLASFNDFVEGTTSTYVTGPMALVNEAVKNTYWFGRLIQGAKSKKKMIQGGANLRQSMIFKDNGTFETYLPGGSHDWKNPQRLKKIQAEWRYTLAHMSWVEQEIMLNDVIQYGDADARFMQFVNIRNEKETEMWTAIWNGMEDLLWRVPDTAEMESSTGTLPYSIPAFINDSTNALYGAGNTNANVTDWTTKEGLDPTDTSLDGKWVPQTQTYGVVDGDGTSTLLPAFDSMFQKVYFEQPPTMQQYWEDPRYNKQMIVTSTFGRTSYMKTLRNFQDHFIAGAQDPAYPDPQFHGIPVQRASTLDALAVYSNTTANTFVVETSTKAAGFGSGPRYYWVNAEYLYPVFHAQRYFYKHEVTKHHNVPDTWVLPIATWYNLLCTSLMRQGLVSPTVNTTPFT